MKFRALILVLFVSHFSQSRENISLTTTRYEERTSHRFGAKSFLPDELVKARPRAVNPLRGRSDGAAEYSRIHRPTRRTTPREGPPCVRARVLHIPYPRRWASLDASVARPRASWTLQRASELSGIPSPRETASFVFNRFLIHILTWFRTALAKLLVALRSSINVLSLVC